MLRPIAVIAAAALAGCATTQPAARPFDLPPAPEGTYTVGLIVSSGTATAQQQADAIAKFVANALGKPARPAVFPDYDTLAAYFAQGRVDVGYLAPLAYVRAAAQGKVDLLAKVVRNGQPISRSVLYAAPGSPLKSLAEVKKAQGLKVAWVDPSSATGYIFPKALLLQNGIDPAGVFVEQAFLGSHDLACKAVLDGRYGLGASYSIDPAGEPVKVITGCQNAVGAQAATLQIVAATEPLPNDVLAVRDGFPADARAALLAAAQGLEQSPEGKQVLKTAFHAEGFTSVVDEDYAPVRAALMVFKQ